MRRIIKDRRLVEDQWEHVADGAALPAGPIIVSLARWRAERNSLTGRPEPLGVRLPNDIDIATLAADLSRFAVIALEFPSFKDGRALTQARLLRERYGYRGEIRAVGDVLRDQLFFMQRCGVNAFELRSDRSLEDGLDALDEFSVTYQPAADEPSPLRRRGR